MRIQILAEVSPPLPQLLVAHVRFTIAINTKAREQLICEYGLFDKVSALSSRGAWKSSAWWLQP